MNCKKCGTLMKRRSFKFGEAQLNVYRWMIWKVKSILVDKLSIVAIIKDFSARKADKESDYPQAPIILIPVKVWDLDKTEDYINERLKAHWQVHSCTPEERWRRADTWAVMKKGRKAALRVLDSEDDAKKWMEANGNKESYIERRIGEDVRCGKYCAVAGVCEIKRERDGGGDVISGQAED